LGDEAHGQKAEACAKDIGDPVVDAHRAAGNELLVPLVESAEESHAEERENERPPLVRRGRIPEQKPGEHRVHAEVNDFIEADDRIRADADARP